MRCLCYTACRCVLSPLSRFGEQMNTVVKMMTAIAGLLVAVAGLLTVFLGGDDGGVIVVLNSPEAYAEFITNHPSNG